ncbi:uncharacterized protein METZ01_LOCUS501684, partial [marine metagenome]
HLVHFTRIGKVCGALSDCEELNGSS